jgi:hypothetical protein
MATVLYDRGTGELLTSDWEDIEFERLAKMSGVTNWRGEHITKGELRALLADHAPVERFPRPGMHRIVKRIVKEINVLRKTQKLDPIRLKDFLDFKEE